MIKKIAILSLLFVAAVFKVEGQTVINLTGATGTFAVQDAAYANAMTNRYNINIGALSKVSLSITYDIENQYDYVRVYETDDNFNVISEVAAYTGKGNNTFSSTTPNGKLVVRFLSDPGTCNDAGLKGFSINYAVAPTYVPAVVSNSTFPTSNSPVYINGTLPTSPNLTVYDSSDKTMWNYSNNTADLTKSLILLKSGPVNQLGISADRISSNQSLFLTSTGGMNFRSNNMTFATTLNANAFRINDRNGISINNPSENFSLINGTIPAGDYARYLIKLRDVTEKYSFQVGSLADFGKGWFPILTTTTIDNTPAFYINAEQNGSSTGDRGIIVFDGRMGHNNTNPPTNQVIVEFCSGWGNRLAHLTGEGSFYVKKNVYVPGVLQASEVKVAVTTSNTADFVFDENYELRPLAEVQSFITTNKHLPDVPSATKMVENGVDLAQMNKVLLQKIEELTLYVINQENRIKQLEKK